MWIKGVELRRVNLPLVRPFETSFGVQYQREALLVRVVTNEAEGWGSASRWRSLCTLPSLSMAPLR